MPRSRHLIIYKITSLVNGKAYIGLTSRGLGARMADHRSRSRSGGHPLYEAVRKHGWHRFRVEVLAEAATVQEMQAIERGLIAEHGTLHPRGYNLSTGGDTCIGCKRTDAMKAAQSERRKGWLTADKLPGFLAMRRRLTQEGRLRRKVPLTAMPEIRARRAAGEFYRTIAADYGCTVQSIFKLLKKECVS